MVKYYNESLTALVFLAAVALPPLSYPSTMALIALLVHSKFPAYQRRGTPAQSDLQAEIADLKRQVNAINLGKGFRK